MDTVGPMFNTKISRRRITVRGPYLQPRLTSLSSNRVRFQHHSSIITQSLNGNLATPKLTVCDETAMSMTLPLFHAVWKHATDGNTQYTQRSAVSADDVSQSKRYRLATMEHQADTAGDAPHPTLRARSRKKTQEGESNLTNQVTPVAKAQDGEGMSTNWVTPQVKSSSEKRRSGSVSEAVCGRSSSVSEAVCQYIDFLTNDNEQKIHVANKSSAPTSSTESFVDFRNELYYCEVMRQPIQVPTVKFREWLRCECNVELELVGEKCQIIGHKVFRPSSEFLDINPLESERASYCTACKCHMAPSKTKASTRNHHSGARGTDSKLSSRLHLLVHAARQTVAGEELVDSACSASDSSNGSPIMTTGSNRIHQSAVCSPTAPLTTNSTCSTWMDALIAASGRYLENEVINNGVAMDCCSKDANCLVSTEVSANQESTSLSLRPDTLIPTAEGISRPNTEFTSFIGKSSSVDSRISGIKFVTDNHNSIILNSCNQLKQQSLHTSSTSIDRGEVNRSSSSDVDQFPKYSPTNNNHGGVHILSVSKVGRENSNDEASEAQQVLALTMIGVEPVCEIQQAEYSIELLQTKTGNQHWAESFHNFL